MYFTHIVFAVVYFLIINLHYVYNQGEGEAPPEEAPADPEDPKVEESTEDPTPEDKHTFVALIDIVFTDGQRRSCTGAVIHDNVVITAAHCFVDCKNEYTQPELTLSFVVIGTKKMFEAGYEQYLPIERIVTHPKFKGWTADLALVFTFSGMMSDKPGKIIPLAGERSSTPVDSNVTVISWGKCKDDTHVTVQTYMRENTYTKFDEERSDGQFWEQTRQHERYDNSEIERFGGDPFYQHRASSKKMNTKIVNRYLSSEELEPRKSKRTTSHRKLQSGRSKGGNRKLKPRAGAKRFTMLRGSARRENNKTAGRILDAPLVKTYQNWRRQMGSQITHMLGNLNLDGIMEPVQNQLTVEVFGFVNVQGCKKLVDRAMPQLYSIKNTNEILCYSSEDHYITKEDSGAPALQQGQLVAVTVGGVETDGDHVAIGMKMSCFCPWIVENLPPGGAEMKCCKNCCDTKHFTGETEKDKAGKQRRNRPNRFYRFQANAEQYKGDEVYSEPEILEPAPSQRPPNF